MKKLLIISIALLLALAGVAQIQIVKNGKASGRIVVDQNYNTDKQAAILLNDFIKRITGTTLPIISQGVKLKNGDIIIESHAAAKSQNNSSGIEEDGFRLISDGSNFRIYAGKGFGTIYGVVTLLEDYFDVHYYAANACTYSRKTDLWLPSNLNRSETPSFRYRQTQAYSIAQDSLYKIWHRLKEPNEIFAGNYWVHTFDRILPSARYGIAHPE